MKSCDVKKGTMAAQNLHDENQDRMFYNDVNISKEDKEMVEGFKAYFKNLLQGSGEAITNKQKQDFLNKEYGTKAERNSLLLDLLAVLDANPQIRPYIKDLALIQLIKTRSKTVIYEDIQSKKEQLKKLPDIKNLIIKKNQNKLKILQIKMVYLISHILQLMRF